MSLVSLTYHFAFIIEMAINKYTPTIVTHNACESSTVNQMSFTLWNISMITLSMNAI